MLADENFIDANEVTNILFVYDRLDIIGGLETRWMDEFQYLKKNNYQVSFLTPQQRFEPKISELFSIHKFIINDIDIATNFIKLVNHIINTIHNEHIQVLSIHMLDTFGCAAVMAAQICQIPVISTIHGTPDIYRRPIERLFIQQLAGKSFSLSISVSQHLKSIFLTEAPLTTVIPNLINLGKYQYQPNNLKSAWLVVNRISPEKYPSILRFLQAANDCKITTVDIAGGGKCAELRKCIDSLNIELQVNFLGEIKDIATLIPKYAGVAGMGRVALEGLACHKPVCIVTPEGNLIGLVTINNLQSLKNYNFIGKGLVSIDNETFFAQLEAYKSEDSQDIYQQLKLELSSDNWDKYIQLYKKVSFIDNKALEAFYHKLAYFANTLSVPFMHDDFFRHLFCETLIEYELNDIQKMWHYYEESIGLMANYPNPYNVSTKSKRWWKNMFK
ncbi:glycosyltransferase family 4 protein [Psychrobacter sp. CAL346-MNA-CIBAN-0220]|uniref:glycosyltransferase family 4 protein n=1 Tax=Psychrobacter sp. CAL346-MNA-CIBAN-0220 TaxID=3140457 RepID=UPI0033336DB4